MNISGTKREDFIIIHSFLTVNIVFNRASNHRALTDYVDFDIRINI